MPLLFQLTATSHTQCSQSDCESDCDGLKIVEHAESLLLERVVLRAYADAIRNKSRAGPLSPAIHYPFLPSSRTEGTRC
jgi:hypothetical protein